MAKRQATTRKTTKRKAAKRERIDTGSDTRYVRRSSGGRFDESDDQGRANASDRRTRAKAKSTSGQGDRGDRRAGSGGRARKAAKKR